ncbi:MAG: hypothetical protein Fur002_15850 [Anaerolineales bacterium]
MLTKRLWQTYAPYLAAAALAALLFAPTIYIQSYIKTKNWESDFGPHIRWAEQIAAQGIQNQPPEMIALSGWHVAVIAAQAALGGSFQKAAAAVSLLGAAAAALILFAWFSKLTWRQALPLTAGALLAAPLSFFFLADGFMYLGYIGINSYQSPTMYLLKPLALLQFFYAYRCFDSSAPWKKQDVALAALVSLLGAWVKPILSITLLPALGIFAAFRLFKKDDLHWGGLIGMIAPTLLALAWQYGLAYASGGESGGGLAFAPLAVMNAYSKNLLPKFFLSIVFPALVLLVHFKDALKSPSMVLSWLTFAVGAFYAYFLTESGLRALDGNFIWCAEIALFILFAASAAFYFRLPQPRARAWIQAAWALHVLFGIAYYLRAAFGNTFF